MARAVVFANSLGTDLRVWDEVTEGMPSDVPILTYGKAGLVLCNTSHRIGAAESRGERIAALEEIGLDAMADGILERWFAKAFRDEHTDLVPGYRMMPTRTPEDGYRRICAAIVDADMTRARAPR